MRSILPRLVNTAAGLWLMFMPAVFGYAESAAAISDRIVGPFIICFSVVAIWEATRDVRLANLPFGAWAVIAPLVLDYPMYGAIGSAAAGVVVIGCSLIRGDVTQRFGGGWSYIFRAAPPEDRLQVEDET